MKPKRSVYHHLTVPTLRNGIDTMWLVELPDGRRGTMYMRGTLDQHDGLFYEDGPRSGMIAKVQDIEGCLYAYVPYAILKVNLFAMSIVWK